MTSSRRRPSSPRVINSIQKNADSGVTPPRYPHPLKEYFVRHRPPLCMAGSSLRPVAPSNPEDETARRIAELIEAPWMPGVVRELLEMACFTLDAHSAKPTGKGGDLLPRDYRFKFDALSPEEVRRHLPKVLREVGDWHVSDGISQICPPAKKKGKGK